LLNRNYDYYHHFVNVITYGLAHSDHKVITLSSLYSIIYRYFNDVEVFCPNDDCSDYSFPAFPYGVIGAVSGYNVGVTFVCGGARTTYTDCAVKTGGNFCQRNAECIQTAGLNFTKIL